MCVVSVLQLDLVARILPRLRGHVQQDVAGAQDLHEQEVPENGESHVFSDYDRKDECLRI